MTDKELRRLSRLELLEMLLAVSKENQKLKEEIEKLKIEENTAKNIENLSAATRQVERALKYADDITQTLSNSAKESAETDENANKTTVVSAEPKAASEEYNAPQLQTADLSDRELYKEILRFFAKNDDKLRVFPAVLENAVRLRINNILKKR